LELAGYLKDSKAHRKMMFGENYTNARDGSMQQLWAQLDLHHHLNTQAHLSDPNELDRCNIARKLLEFVLTRDGVVLAELVVCLAYCIESAGMI